MSKTLTQLGYDLATIFNVDYDIVMEVAKCYFRQTPPNERMGFHMSEATFKLVALKHSIGVTKR